MQPPNEKPMGPSLELIPSFGPGTNVNSHIEQNNDDDTRGKRRSNQRKRKVLSRRERLHRKHQRKSAS